MGMEMGLTTSAKRNSAASFCFTRATHHTHSLHSSSPGDSINTRVNHFASRTNCADSEPLSKAIQNRGGTNSERKPQ